MMKKKRNFLGKKIATTIYDTFGNWKWPFTPTPPPSKKKERKWFEPIFSWPYYIHIYRYKLRKLNEFFPSGSRRNSLSIRANVMLTFIKSLKKWKRKKNWMLAPIRWDFFFYLRFRMPEPVKMKTIRIIISN